MDRLLARTGLFALLCLCTVPPLYWKAFSMAASGNVPAAWMVMLVDGPNPTTFSREDDLILLSEAAGNGALPVVQYLIAHGADLNAGGVWGTPIQSAAFRGQLDTVRYLAAQGASYDTPRLYCSIAKEYINHSGVAGARLVLEELPLRGDLAELRERMTIDVEAWEAHKQQDDAERIAYLRDFMRRHPEVLHAPIAPGSMAEYFSRRHAANTAAGGGSN